MDSRELIERLTLGLPSTLEKRPGICDVKFSNFSPAPRHTLVAWEQRNTCMLPDDLKNFYLTTDGLLLTWKVNTGDSEHPLGRMEINPLADLHKLSITGSTATCSSNISLADVDYDSESDDESDQTHKRPHFDGRSRIFELDSCNGFGKVCLVYVKASPGLPAQSTEIWFLDRALNWSFLAADFTTYYRLMLVHIGLPQWQYAFTPIGLSPKVKQWFSMYAPVRLKIDEEILLGKSLNRKALEVPYVKVDWQKVFKGKSVDKGKGKVAASNLPANRKKQPAPSQALSASKSLTSMRHGRSTKPWT